MSNSSSVDEGKVVANGSELEVVDVGAGEDGEETLPAGVEASQVSAQFFFGEQGHLLKKHVQSRNHIILPLTRQQTFQELGR